MNNSTIQMRFFISFLFCATLISLTPTPGFAQTIEEEAKEKGKESRPETAATSGSFIMVTVDENGKETYHKRPPQSPLVEPNAGDQVSPDAVSIQSSSAGNRRSDVLLGSNLMTQGNLNAYGSNLLGDQIDPASGGIQFVQTDVSIPGNFPLEVAIRRKRVQGSYFLGTNSEFGLHQKNWPMF